MAKSRELSRNARIDDLKRWKTMLHSSETIKFIEKISPDRGKNAIPITELRKQVDKEMGEKTLTEELDKMREER